MDRPSPMPPAPHLTAYLGRIVSAASLESSGKTFTSALACRRIPKRQSCPGWLEITRQDVPSQVHWSCTKCGDGGVLEGWKGGPHDLSSLGNPGDPRKMLLDPQLQAFGLKLELPDAPCSTVFLRSRRTPRGIECVAPARDLEALAAWVEQEQGGTHGAQTRTHLANLHQALGIALGRVQAPTLKDLAQAVLARQYAAPAQRPRRTGRARPVQVKVTLRHIRPPVWRRLVLPGELSLADLHAVLQAAFGWSECHLHSFRTSDGRLISDPEMLDMEVEDELEVRIADVLFSKGGRLIYEYDFGDGWEHELVVEQVLDTAVPAPRCLAGRRAGPPEDCGGPFGYSELIAAHGDPNHPRHRELTEWHPYLRPEEFDLQEVNERLGGG
jgi:Plasmid pRiA4b ORF-3-like protein